MASDPTTSGDITIVPLTGNLAISSIGKVGTIADGLDPATGDHILTVNVDDMRSTARRKADGSVSLEAQGTGAGNRNQPRTITTLCQRLEADGHTVVIHGEGKDDWGEDGILTVDGVRYVLQIVTAVPPTDFWREASTGVAVREVDDAGAVDWVRASIEAKAPKCAPSTVLALDAQHTGVLAIDGLVSAYLKRFKDPQEEFGFAAVWLVGPTVLRCVRMESRRI